MCLPMRELPRIAVVTPSYNTGRHIGAAVRSVLDQDYRNFDYMVMDGGSTDQTVDVLRGFGDRLRWVSQKDNGQADAIDKGFAQTGGEILSWLNSDDTYAPGAFRAVAEFFAANPDVDVVYGDADYTDAQGRFIAPCVHVEPFNRRRLLLYSDFIVQPATFFRRSAYEAVGGVDPNIHWAMDYDLWLKMAGQFSFAYLPRRLADFRWLANNKTATGSWGRLDEIGRILRRQGYGIPAFIRLERVNLHAREAIDALTHGKPGPAMASAARAAAMALSSPRVIRSLLSIHTWRIMWVGQVLRRRAAAADQRQEQVAVPSHSAA